MGQVLRGMYAASRGDAPTARCAVEILRTDSEAVLAMLDSDCAVTLISHPLTWAEVGEQFRSGKAIFNFEDVWKPLMRRTSEGILEQYPLYEAVRKIIRGCYSAPVGFKAGSLDALMDVLPHGDVHLFTREWGFIGRFASVEDATMIGGALKAVKPIIFSTAEEFMGLGAIDQGVVLYDLDPAREWPVKITTKFAQGVLEMAKGKTKSKAKKVVKAEAKQRRADGPVAQARAIFEQMKDKPSSDIIAACEAKGINRGTATTQLGRWRKENGIVVKRGGARKKEKGDKSAATPASPKKGGKKKGGKKKAEPKPAGIPPSTKKGEKRHKPPAASSGQSSPSSASPSSETKSQEKNASAASAQGTSPATASTASATANAASSSPAASGPTPAGGSATNAKEGSKS